MHSNTITSYPGHLKVSRALEMFFDKYHFADGGYNLKWFHIKVGIINIPLPNIKARVEVAKIHDIHHVLTGYEATLRGEAEIAGWEIASGCDKYFVAWFFNMGSFFYGLFFFPVPLFKAFVRGSKVKTNYYHLDTSYEQLLNKTVGEMHLEIDPLSVSENPSPTPRNYLHFVLISVFVFASVIFVLCSLEVIFKAILHLFN